MINSASLEIIRVLNNEAVHLSNQLNDSIGAIEILQHAFIICKDLEVSRPISAALKSWKPKRKRSLCTDTLAAAPLGGQETRGLKTPCHQIPEFSRSSKRQRVPACALAIVPVNIQIGTQHSSILQSMPFPMIEAILCFNLGICYLKEEDAEEARLYFGRTDVLLSEFTDIYSKTSHIDLKVGVLHDLSAFELSLDGFLRYFKAGSFTAQKYYAPLVSERKTRQHI